MYVKFWFNGDFFVRNLDSGVELYQCHSLLHRNSFFTLQNGALSFFFKNFFVLLYFIYLFFCFFIKYLLPLLIFSMSKDFFHKLRASTFEFCQVSDANSY